MLTELQKRTAQAVVNIFETSRALGEYGQVTLLADDPGHLTYGRSQTTLASGNLHLLVKAYCQDPDAAFGAELGVFLDRLAACDTGLDHEAKLRGLLREAGEDLIMRDVQDAFFDRVYWTPAVEDAESLGIRSALGICVAYDSRVHGSWQRLGDRTTAAHGAASQIGEHKWVEHYVEERRAWLAGHKIRQLRATVYRMDSFRQLIAGDLWDLPLPLRVRGVLIDKDALLGAVPVRASVHDPGERALRRTTPPMAGEDVLALQRALQRAGVAVDADGVFGAQTEAAVREFQVKRGLTVDGIVGPASRAALGFRGSSERARTKPRRVVRRRPG